MNLNFTPNQSYYATQLCWLRCFVSLDYTTLWKSNSGLNPVYVQCASAWTSIPWQKNAHFLKPALSFTSSPNKKNKALLHNNTKKSKRIFITNPFIAWKLKRNCKSLLGLSVQIVQWFLLSIMLSEKMGRGFQFIQDLDFLGMYFDALVVFVIKFSILFKLALSILSVCRFLTARSFLVVLGVT